MSALLVMQLLRLEEGKLKTVIGAAFADIAFIDKLLYLFVLKR